nr:MAG TPA: hypothetical protein [Caudoviricetes sp.]
MNNSCLPYGQSGGQSVGQELWNRKNRTTITYMFTVNAGRYRY